MFILPRSFSRKTSKLVRQILIYWFKKKNGIDKIGFVVRRLEATRSHEAFTFVQTVLIISVSLYCKALEDRVSAEEWRTAIRGRPQDYALIPQDYEDWGTYRLYDIGTCGRMFKAGARSRSRTKITQNRRTGAAGEAISERNGRDGKLLLSPNGVLWDKNINKERYIPMDFLNCVLNSLIYAH